MMLPFLYLPETSFLQQRYIFCLITDIRKMNADGCPLIRLTLNFKPIRRAKPEQDTVMHI